VKPIEIVSKPVERVPLNLREPKIEGLGVPQWVVVTSDNQEAVWARLNEQGTKPVLFGLTEEGYQDLSFLMSTLRGLIVEQRTIIQKYKEYYEPVDKKRE
jgi:hypothetical protein